jgi:hypothetical protein
MAEELLAAFGSALSQSDVERALSVCEEFELLQVPPTRFPDRSANVGLRAGLEGVRDKGAGAELCQSPDAMLPYS